MKLFISVDMEGVSGVYKREQTVTLNKDWEAARKLMTEEVNSAVEGAMEAGVTDVTICDAHSSGENLIIEMLKPNCSIVRTGFKPLCMMEGIDSSMSAVFLLGYHAKAGASNATLPHTYYGKIVHEVKINGTLFGETALNSALAGHYGVPIVLVSGDQTLCAEARRFIPKITAFCSKTALSGLAAKIPVPQVIKEKLRKAAKIAIEQRKIVKPFSVKTPIVFEVTYNAPRWTDAACLIPWIKRISSRKIRFKCDDFKSAYSAFRSTLALCSTI
ncbi:MAG: M55 family metallopeptidase [Planctomycetota bacterium]